MNKAARLLEPASQKDLTELDRDYPVSPRSAKFQPVSEILKRCDEKAGQLYRPLKAFA